MNINQLDLNLLIILKQLLEEKHISNTALTLGISQPSISRSLAKLRVLFDDQHILLVSLEWTSWAEQINAQGYSHGDGEGRGNMPTILRYILPFVKELILIGVPMLITVGIAKLIGRFKKR